MLYLDYSRKEGEWIPNKFGGRENLEAIEFLRRFNTEVYKSHPDVADHRGRIHGMADGIAADICWRSRLRLKWDMGWMHDTLQVLEPRSGPSQVSPQRTDVSDDLCVSRKLRPAAVARRSRARKRFASRQNARRSLAEIRQSALAVCLHVRATRRRSFSSWAASSASGANGRTRIVWMAPAEFDSHRQLQRWVSDLNQTYRRERRFIELDCDPAGFEWIDGSDSQQSMLSFMRKSRECVGNHPRRLQLHSGPRYNYRVGVPRRRLLAGDSQQ